MSRKRYFAAALAAAVLLPAPSVAQISIPGCTVQLFTGGPSEARDIALQPDGRIVVAGYTELSGDRDFLIARFHPDLSLDTTFGGTGWVTTNFDRDDEAWGVAVQTDGKIVAVGFAVNNGAGTQKSLAIARYLPDGSLDPDFAGGGAIMYFMPSSAAEELRGVALQPDGKIVAVGFHEGFGPRQLLVARFLKDGSLDPSFDTDGTATPVIGDVSVGSDVAIARDGGIVVSATGTFTGNNDLVAARFLPDGTLDTNFNSPDGWVQTDIANPDDDATAVVVDANGNVTVSGTSSADISIVRYRPDGTLDGGFGTGGIKIHDIGTDAGHDVALDDAGNVVVVGEGGTTDFALTRFTPSGSLDLSVTKDIDNVDRSFALAIRPDGKLLLAGTSNASGFAFLTLARFNADGTQDCGELFLNPFGDSASGFVPVGSCVNNWQCVNDNGDLPTGFANTDHATSYVESATPSAIDRYRLDDGHLPAGKVVTGIEIVVWNRWSGAGVQPSFEVLYQRQGFDPVPVRSAASFANSGVFFSGILPEWTDLNWTSAELDALEIGVEHVSGNDLQISQLYVKVTYADPQVHPVEPFTAGATGDGAGGQVTLNWLNPAFGLYGETVIRRSEVACPTSPTSDDAVVNQADGPGQAGSFVDTVAIGPTYYYSAFVVDADNHASPGKCVKVTPFDRDASKVDWIYSTADPIAALATPGLLATTGVAYTATNDGVVHAITGGSGGTGGGSWPSGWKPYRLGAKAPSRPPVAKLDAAGSWAALFAAEDGHVYAVDSATGELVWRSPRLGTMLSSSPAAILSAFGAAHNLVFAATRDAGMPNRLYALNADDGTVAWFFENGGPATGIGIVTSGPVVSYADERVYFTSFAGASVNTVWCLDFTTAPFTQCGTWPGFGVATSLGGDVGASPSLFNGLLFVADQAPGESLYAFLPADGSESAMPYIGGGGAKEYMFPRFSTSDLIVTNASEVMSIDTAGAGVNWVCSIPSPSAPLQVPGTNDIYVGGGDGKLHRLSTIAPGCPGTSECIGDCVSTTVGSPAYDVFRSMIYLGTLDGEIYGVKTPF
jgi:uncharacterized delta-60 repeat protein